ncbi:MAG: amidohydrolase family protein, partial [Kangiellaceae bacterium]|nr:amidohydrolase family protein [Kangiellaceae bacterium]
MKLQQKTNKNWLKRPLKFGCVLATVWAGSVLAETTVIYAGKLLAKPGEKPLSEQTIVVEKGKIKSVEAGFIQVKKVDRILDLKQSFVMPGLMDMHVHLQGELGPGKDSESLKMSDELMAMRSTHYAMKTLLAGFTTVRDVGSDPQYMYALRDAINKGWVEGPRIIAAGGVGITGGHGDVSGVKPDLMEYYSSKQVCDGPYDCRRAARRAIKFGGDWIKVASTGGVLTDRATGTGQQMQLD